MQDVEFTDENLKNIILKSLAGDSEKLSNWENEPTIVDLKKDFEIARQYHGSQVSKIKKWLDNLNVEGNAKVKAKKGSSQIVPKLIRKQAEWRYAALSEPFLNTTEIFDVNPVSWEDRKAAQQNALVLNNQWQTKIDKIGFIDEFVRTVVDEGTVIVRVGWNYEEGVVRQKVNQYQYVPAPELMEQYQQMLPQLQQNPKLFKAQTPEDVFAGLIATLQGEVPVRAVLAGVTEELVQKVIHNHPTVEVCDFRNVYIDPTCNGDMDKAQFVIHSFETTLAELKRDKRYKNLEQIKTEHASANYDSDHSYSYGSQAMQFSDRARKKIVVYEYWGYWDIHNDGLTKPIVVSWCGDTLIRMEENPFPDAKLPFVVASYLPKRKEIYGEPDGELLEDNQKILGAVTRGMIDLLGKSANAQMGVSKQVLDATNKIKFERGENYEFNPQTDPRRDIFMHTYPEIPNSAMFMVQLMNHEAESLTGVKAFSSGGITGEGLGETAAGVRGALDAASKREMGILRRISNAIIKIGRKMIAMNSEFLSDEEVIRITNDEFVAVKRDDLAGNFDLKLTISTAEADNAKAQELAFMLQTMGSALHPSMSNMLLAEIARLRQMPDLAHAIETFKPEPDPMEEQMKQLQMQMLQAQVMLTQAQAQEAGAKSQLNMAKINVEGARAENMQSDADRKALDFVHDQEGVNHARAMELEQVKNDALDRQKLLDIEKVKQQEAIRGEIAKQHAIQQSNLNAKDNLIKSYVDSQFKLQGQTLRK